MRWSNFLGGFLVAIAYVFNSYSTAMAINSSWLMALDGAWNTVGNWSTPNYPSNGSPSSGSRYDVTIDATGSPYTVTLEQAITVDSVTIDSADATLRVAGNYHFSGPNGIHVEQGTLVLDNGARLYNSRLSTGVAGRAISGPNNYVTLYDVELAGKFEAYNYLSLDDTLEFDNGVLQFAAGNLYSGTNLTGTGEWQLKSGHAETFDFQYRINFYSSAGHEITIGPGVTVRSMGESVALFKASYLSQEAADTVVNQGQILAETAGGTFYIAKFRNEGLVRIANGDRFAATYAGAVGEVDLQAGGEMFIYGSPRFNSPLNVGADETLYLRADAPVIVDEPLTLEPGGTITLASPHSFVPIVSTGGQVNLGNGGSTPITVTQLMTLPISGPAMALLNN